MSNPQVELHVTINVADTATQGVITLELDAKNAPKTTENFLNYVNNGFYDGTIFHRVIKNFMIQGGGFTADMKQKPTNDPIENEGKNGLKNDKYSIAMARTSDPHSATAQFFINVVDNDFLNHTSRLGLCSVWQSGQGHRSGRRHQEGAHDTPRLPRRRAF